MLEVQDRGGAGVQTEGDNMGRSLPPACLQHVKWPKGNGGPGGRLAREAVGDSSGGRRPCGGPCVAQGAVARGRVLPSLECGRRSPGWGAADEGGSRLPGAEGLGRPSSTAASLQRHRTRARSSRAQPASPGASPSPQPWTVPRCRWRGCSIEGGSETHGRRSPSPWEECRL